MKRLLRALHANRDVIVLVVCLIAALVAVQFDDDDDDRLEYAPAVQARNY